MKQLEHSQRIAVVGELGSSFWHTRSPTFGGHSQRQRRRLSADFEEQNH
ncbi:hypothetical protein O9992_24915 [Vibrio lentus]|nr:hypothetical protein [Vibrio lentus]